MMNLPRVVRIESKSFSVRKDTLAQGGDVLITEQCRGKSFHISLEVDCVEWVRNQLHDASKGGGAQFFRQVKGGSFLLWVECHRNSKGWFMRLSKRTGGVVRSLVIPQGHNASGWRAMEDCLGEFLNLIGERCRTATRREGGRPFPSSLSFRDVVEGGKWVKSGRLGSLEGGSRNWSLVLVIERKQVHHSWKEISGALADSLGKMVRIFPFQSNKAFMECENREVMLQTLRLDNRQDGGLSQVCVSKWEQSWGLNDAKVVSYGGWVAVSGLPLNWWTPNFFSQVGEACGGLLQVDRKTETFQHCFEAKIKVKGNDVGFLPQFVRVSDGEVAVVVSLTPISPAIRPPCKGGSASTYAEGRSRLIKAREGGSDYRQFRGQDASLTNGHVEDIVTQRIRRMPAAVRADNCLEGVRLEGGRRDVICGSRKPLSDYGGMGEDVFLKGSGTTEVGNSFYRLEDFCCDIRVGDVMDGNRLGSSISGPKLGHFTRAKCGGPFLGLGPAEVGPNSAMRDKGHLEGSILGAGPVSSLFLPSSNPSRQRDFGPSLPRPRETVIPSSSASSFFSKVGKREGASTLRRLDPKCFGTFNAKEAVDSKYSSSSDDDDDTNFTDGIDSEMGASTVFGDESDPYWDRIRKDVLGGDGSIKDFDDADSSQQAEGEALDLSLCEDGMLEKLFEEPCQDPEVAISHDCLGVKGRMNQEPDMRTYCRRKELSLVPVKTEFKAKNCGILSKMGISVVPLKKSLIYGKAGGFGSVSKVQGGKIDRKTGKNLGVDVPIRPLR